MASNVTKSTVSESEIKRLKGLGCLRDKRYPDVFNVRVVTGNGKISSKAQKDIAEAAELFGSGEVAMTTRLSIEIQGVPYENTDKLFSYLDSHGLLYGGTGPKVRPVVSCKGTTCVFGLIDTYSLSEKIHNRFYLGYRDAVLPHKFKIGIGGCPNNCVKPDLNDIGIIGASIPSTDTEKCRACKSCAVEKACPVNNAKLTGEKISIEKETCNRCGRCVTKCPFGAVTESAAGYRMHVGGRWGKRVARGRELNYLFTSEDELMDAIERAIILFRDEGIQGERFSDTIERLGFSYVESKIIPTYAK